jgi:hypothetical protein
MGKTSGTRIGLLAKLRARPRLLKGKNTSHMHLGMNTSTRICLWDSYEHPYVLMGISILIYMWAGHYSDFKERRPRLLSSEEEIDTCICFCGQTTD